MSRTGFVYHPTYLRHQTGDGHPESPARLNHLINHLNGTDIYECLDHIAPIEAERRWIEKIHPENYTEMIKKACISGLHSLDSDTSICQDSFDAATAAVGGALSSVDYVMQGRAENAFCAIRPPGHHAEPTRAMGFCLFNNVAIAARYLQSKHSLERICIIDWDVHHGNGTQTAFYHDPSILYISIHEHPWYPGTGLADEDGALAGVGMTLNVPCRAGCGDEDYLNILEDRVRPKVDDFGPDFILISSGFDAHRDDPLANMQLSETGFSNMTRLVRRWAQEHCEGRLVSLLEGGYHLQALSLCVEKHLRVLLED